MIRFCHFPEWVKQARLNLNADHVTITNVLSWLAQPARKSKCQTSGLPVKPGTGKLDASGHH